MNKNREYAFDILRVISMFMVIVIHVSNIYSRNYGVISNSTYLLSLVFNTICRISVPIFLMISGALLLDRKFDKNKYIKRIKKYIILILVWDIIYLIWEYFYFGITYEKLYMLLINPYRAHLWFLYVILVLYVLQPLIKRIFDKINNNTKIILLCIWIILSTASMFNSIIAQVFTIFSYIGFFILGKYLYNFIKKYNLKKYNLLFILIIVICCTLSIILNYSTSIKYNQFYNLFFAYRTPFISFSSFAFYILIISNYQRETLNKIVIKLSDLSLGVYLIHGIFLDIIAKAFIYSSTNSMVGIPIFSIIIFILSIISVYIIRKIKILKNIT